MLHPQLAVRPPFASEEAASQQAASHDGPAQHQKNDQNPHVSRLSLSLNAYMIEIRGSTNQLQCSL
jgi:hypothetical protein